MTQSEITPEHAESETSRSTDVGAPNQGGNPPVGQPLAASLLTCVTRAEVVGVVVERGIIVLGAQAGLVALISADGKDLEIVRASGFASHSIADWDRFPLDEPYPLSDVVKNGAALYLGDRSDSAPQYPDLIDYIDDAFKASVSLRLASPKRVFGAMHFAFTHVQEFNETVRVFLDQLSQQCALALERALLLEEIEEARARQAFLAQASALLGESLVYQTRLEALAHLCVPELADWACVDVLGENNELVRLAVAHRIPAREAIMREIQERYPPDAARGQNSLTVIQTGERLFYSDIPEDLIDQGAVDSEHARLLKLIGVRAALSLPLTTRGRTLGALTLGMAPNPEGSGRLFTPELLALADEVARRAAVAMDNARLYTAAQREARERVEAEARFRLMADCAAVLIWTSGADAKFDWFNVPWLAFTGRTMEQEIGNGWAEGVHPEDFDGCLEIYLDAFAARRPFTMEYRLHRNDGEWRWLLVNGVPVYEGEDTARRFKGYIGSCMDITEMKRAQMEQQRLVTELREAGQRQRRFLKEMLAGFTEGRLHLCFRSDELPTPLPPLSDLLVLSEANLRLLRKRVEAIAEGLKLPKERMQQAVTAIHEAAMNAVKYGGDGAAARVHGDIATGLIQAWVTDQGPGIAEDLIHRALERGYTTAGFGHGMFLMQSYADRLYLLTGPKGTTVVIEVERQEPDPVWLKSEVG